MVNGCNYLLLTRCHYHNLPAARRYEYLYRPYLHESTNSVYISVDGFVVCTLLTSMMPQWSGKTLEVLGRI